MKIKIVIATLCIVLSLILLAGCNAKDAEGVGVTAEITTAAETLPPVPPTDYSEKTFYPAEILEHLKLHGRSAVIEKSVTCDWTASGIEFSADCKGDIYLDMTTTLDTYLTVYIDGVRMDELKYNHETKTRDGNTYYLDVGTHRVKIASDLEEGLHTVRVLRQNMNGNTSVDAIVLSGELRERPADREMFIEFVGDSTTCGYAALGINKLLGLTTTDDKVGAATTEGTSAYAYLTAEAMQADCSMLAISGIGFYKGSVSYPMTDVYPCISYRRDHTQKDFQPTRTPDVVVVNLGENDEGRIKTNTAEFKAHVEDLIAQIRTTYTESTPIVFCYNSTIQCKIAPPLIQEVIDAKGGAEAGLYSLVMTTDISPVTPTKHTHNGAPGNHPNVEQHQKQADTLTAFLKEILK